MPFWMNHEQKNDVMIDQKTASLGNRQPNALKVRGGIDVLTDHVMHKVCGSIRETLPAFWPSPEENPDLQVGSPVSYAVVAYTGSLSRKPPGKMSLLPCS
jgi:hypothetical protein